MSRASDKFKINIQIIAAIFDAGCRHLIEAGRREYKYFTMATGELFVTIPET